MPAPASTTNRVQFGVFELDLQKAELRKSGIKVKLQEQPLRILQILLESPGQIVGREELQKRLWPANTFVEFDQGLYSAMARLRDALGDSSESPRFIETVARRGYRFIAPVTGQPVQTPSKPPVELSGSGRLRSARVSLSVTAGLAAGTLLLAVFLGANLGGTRDWLRRQSNPHVRTLAVLPLENLSGDPNQEYFADGMTDELITRLASVGNVQVVSRTSVMQFKHTQKPLPQIGKDLNADAVVEGSIVRSGNRVRITAQLVQVTTDQHLWAKDYEGDLGDVLQLQDEIARAITSEINIKLTTAEQTRLSVSRSVNPRAYEFYLQARYLADRPDPDKLKLAVKYYEQSIDVDPNYAKAWAGLGEAYSLQAGSGGFQNEEEGWRKARETVGHALALDPNLAEAHSTLGQLQLFHDWDWQSANSSLQKAMTLEPNNAAILQKRAWLEAIQGRLQQALELDHRALSLDPLSVTARSDMAIHAYFSGRMEESADAAHHILELDEQASGEHFLLALIQLEQGHAAEALVEARREPDSLFRTQAFVLSYYALGRLRESEAALNELIGKVKVGGAFQIAEEYGYLGNAQQTCNWLNRAYDQHDSGLALVKVDRAFNKLESDACYEAFLKKMNLMN